MNTKPMVNAGELERVVVGVLGLALLLHSVRVVKPLALVGAACLLYRAFSGSDQGYEVLGVNISKIEP